VRESSTDGVSAGLCSPSRRRPSTLGS
jgi:hypothetical protein